MYVTEYRSYINVDNAKIKNYTWKEFCEKISRPCAMIGTTYDNFIKLPKSWQKAKELGADDYQDRIKSLAGGAVFGKMEGNGRSKSNFPTRSAISLDYEKCNEDIYERIHNALKDITYCYHTTCKHLPPDDCRLHLIIPFVRNIEWHWYSIAAVRIAERIGTDGLDVSCIKRSQMMLYPVQLRESEYKYYVHNAEMLDVDDSADWIPIAAEMDFKKYEVKEMIVRKRVEKSVKKYEVYTGNFVPVKARQGDVKSCFNAVFSVRNILDMRSDYIPEGERYRYAAASGSAGVWVSDDGTRAGSYHSNAGDPLFGHSYTAFDLYLLFYTDENERFQDRIRKAHRFAKENKKYENLYYGGA